MVVKRPAAGKTKAAKKGARIVRGAANKAHAGVDDFDGLDAVLLETAQDMHDGGLMDRAGLDKITMRHARRSLVVLHPISGEQIRRMRERAKMSQTVFAQVLNVTSGYVSQLERGDKEPKGTTLKLLDVIKRKGVGALI